MSQRPDFTPPGITAGAAVIAGFLLLSRQADEGLLASAALGVGAAALVLIVLANREREWGAFKALTGPDGHAAPLASPLAWLAGVLALLVVATILLPGLGIPWLTKDNILAIGLVLFLAFAILGWGPSVSRAWPSGLRLSTLTVVGSLVAVGLIGVYLYFLVGMREQAVATGLTDATWARLVELRSTLEALAFAAAGALLGQTVGRQTASQELGETKQQLAKTQGTADVAVTQALDTLTAESVAPDAVSAANAKTVAAPADKDAAIKKARGILVAARDRIRADIR